MGSLTPVAMGAILSFFFPPADAAPDTSETKEDESGVKEVEKEVDSEKADMKKTPEMTDATVTVPKITEEAMEEADYEVVETNDPSTLSAAGFPRTPQNSFANLPSIPSAGQLDDGFEVISQRTEEPTSLLNIDNTAVVVENEEDNKEEEEEEEESPIANLKSGVEALLTDLSASAAGPEQEEESVSTTTSSVVTEETSTTTTIVQEVQSIGEVEDNAKEATKTDETMES